jgi:hypothetical protein
MPYSSSFGGLGPGSVYSSAAAGGGGGVSAPGSVAGLKMQPAGRLRRIFVTGGVARGPAQSVLICAGYVC